MKSKNISCQNKYILWLKFNVLNLYLFLINSLAAGQYDNKCADNIFKKILFAKMIFLHRYH